MSVKHGLLALSWPGPDGPVLPQPESEGGLRPYRITDAGRADLAAWFTTPVERSDRPRDELAIKQAYTRTRQEVSR